jgi:hypothetical protein
MDYPVKLTVVISRRFVKFLINYLFLNENFVSGRRRCDGGSGLRGAVAMNSPPLSGIRRVAAPACRRSGGRPRWSAQTRAWLMHVLPVAASAVLEVCHGYAVIPADGFFWCRSAVVGRAAVPVVARSVAGRRMSVVRMLVPACAAVTIRRAMSINRRSAGD